MYEKVSVSMGRARDMICIYLNDRRVINCLQNNNVRQRFARFRKEAWQWFATHEVDLRIVWSTVIGRVESRSFLAKTAILNTGGITLNIAETLYVID